MTILEQILAGLQQKFTGVDTAIMVFPKTTPNDELLRTMRTWMFISRT